MDRELRELERKALTGDRDALFLLLARKISLNDFDVNDLGKEVRMQLVTELLGDVSLLEMFECYFSVDPNFYPEHQGLRCPKDCDNPLYLSSYGYILRDLELTEGQVPIGYNPEHRMVSDVISCSGCNNAWYSGEELNDIDFY